MTPPPPQPLLRRFLPFLRVKTGETSRLIAASPERVFAALMADPTPEELERWRMTAFHRVREDYATYLSRGRPTEAFFQPVDPPREFRWTSRCGLKVQALHYRLTPERDGTRVRLRVRLSFRVRARHMARVIEEAVDGVEARLRAGGHDESGSPGDDAS